jgi:hypothetical protein
MTDPQRPAVVSFSEREAARARAFRRALRSALRGVLAARFAAGVVVAVLVIGATAAIILYARNPYALVYYGDAASHLVKSRAIVDWGDDPGLARFGTVWLPVPHLLLLPFALVGSLFSSGWAGAVVGLPCLALSAAFLYCLVRREVGATWYLAAIAALVYGLNPNILYVSMTAMTEAPFMLFFIGSAYFLSRWLHDPDRWQDLGLASLLVVLATLCRYEGWFLPIALVALVLWRSGRRRVSSIVLALVSFAGIAGWAAYNALLYGDPLQFADVEFYSAASQAQNRPYRETLFLQPLNVLGVYFGTAIVVYGPVLLAAALGLVRLRRLRHAALLVFLAMPPLSSLVSMVTGVGEMTFWFNARFLILLSPLLVVLAVTFVQNVAQAHRRWVLAGSAALCFLFATLVVVLDKVPTYLDAQKGFLLKDGPAVQTGERLRSTYDGGKIVVTTGSAPEQRIMVAAGISLDHYDEIIDSSTWKGSYTEPWRYGRWFVLGKAPESDAAAAIAYWSDRRSELDAHYSVVYENDGYEILVRK